MNLTDIDGLATTEHKHYERRRKCKIQKLKNFLQAQKLGSQQCFLEKLRKGGKKAIDEELEQDDESQAAKATKLANLDNF